MKILGPVSILLSKILMSCRSQYQSFINEQGCKLFFSYGSQFFGYQRGGYELALEFYEQPGDTSDLRNPTFTYLTDNLFLRLLP